VNDHHSYPDRDIPAGSVPFYPTRVLVVDDDHEIRKLHAAILTFAGYDAEMAKDGAEALEQLSNGRFDLLFTDRLMPVLDGESLVLALRSAGIRIPIVMVSGSLEQCPLSERVAREISAALPKPIRADELLAAIFAALHPSPKPLPVAA
jgi:CheY-like chemotaxis protein